MLTPYFVGWDLVGFKCLAQREYFWNLVNSLATEIREQNVELPKSNAVGLLQRHLDPQNVACVGGAPGYVRSLNGFICGLLIDFQQMITI